MSGSLRPPTPAVLEPGLADTVMLRINPLPGRRLGTSELTAAVRVLVETEQLCAALADAACAELFDLAAGVTGRERQRILDLKRAVFNHRSPDPATDDPGWPTATSAWLAAKQRSDLARSVLTTGYDTCLARERAGLAETITAEPFQLSLALTSPQVLEAVRRYARSGGSPSKRDRKSERGILQHLARAMVRTSPLARFTAVGFGSWSEHGSTLDRTVFQRRRAHSALSMDRVLVSTLATGLLPAGDTVARSPSLRVMQGSVRFHHRDGSQVRVLSAPLTAQLRILLDLTAMGPVTTADLGRALADRTAVPLEDAERIVGAACEAQILVAGPVLDEQAVDPLQAARELLRDHAPAAADALAGVSAELGRMATATVSERVALLHRLESAQHQLNTLGSRPVQLHVNEDYVLEPFEVSPAGYEQALDDAAEVAGFASVFDRHHELRALLCTLFVDRFGPGASVSLIDHATDLVTGVLSREGEIEHGAAEDFGPPDGSLAQLLKVREGAVRAVAERIARHSAKGSAAEELVLEPGLLSELTAALPERFGRSAASYGLLVQPDAGRLVLNGCYAGHGLLGTRFLGADRDLGGRAAESVARRAEAVFSADGARPREDRGLHGVNINHRIPLLEREITPEEWAGIRLAHDTARDELVLLDPDGVRVRPVSLGMRWLELFPAPLRLAMWLAETSRVMVDSFGWEQVPALDGTVPQRTVSTPRLAVGRMVLQRRRWYPGADFPSVPGPEGPAGHLVDLTVWRAAHGVPEEVVIKSDLGSGFLSHEETTRNYLVNHRREKPQYADLASALTVRVLPRLLDRRASGSYLEEALPGVRQGRHATEWVIELDRPAGARFQPRKP
ncbi:lantibiotic dehydratase [Streptacidiphilus sp. N1-3]|uniref:Lantibiotic dehydratase n=1 Tax=Streptacidiphilus alkalitolerans TaxID=3342712 RepID=A0ABV6X214_9ACTN